MKKKTDHGSGQLNGFLDSGSQIRGELLFEDTFRVDGRVTGTVVSRGDLVVGDVGEIDGDIQVNRVFISGTVRGTIQAKARVEIASTGKVIADVDSPCLVVEEGAFLEGRCSMKRPGSLDDSGLGESKASVSRIPLPREG